MPDLVVNLRPTSPLRTPRHVDDAIRLLLESGADSVKAVCLARQHPHKMWLRHADGTLEPYLKTAFRLSRGPDVPRAELEDVYWQNGVVDVTRHTVIREQRVMIGRRVAGLVTSLDESIDIDTPRGSRAGGAALRASDAAGLSLLHDSRRASWTPRLVWSRLEHDVAARRFL